VNHPVAPPDRPLEAVARELAEANARLKQTNEELARLYEKSRDMDELKSRFFANVSHELRTPLTLILGPVARRLATKSVPPEERRELEIIDRNARLLLHHVTDLLDVARLEAGRMRMSYAEFDLALLVRLVSSHFETLAGEHRIRFGVDTPDALAAQADFDKVRRILLNLLSNAFNPHRTAESYRSGFKLGRIRRPSVCRTAGLEFRPRCGKPSSNRSVGPTPRPSLPSAAPA